MGIGPILGIQCTGNEDGFDLCNISSNDRNYDHSNDAGVICLSHTQFVSNLCTNEFIFDSECKMFRSDVTVSPTTDIPLMVKDDSLPAVLGTLLGITVIVLICVVIGWVLTCILLWRKLNDALMSKRM